MCREYTEDREIYWISVFDTWRNGLNKTPHGKGQSDSSKFTTLGRAHTIETKKKMSEAHEGRDPSFYSKISNSMWAKPGMKEHQSSVRRGRRLSQPKITDQTCREIMDEWALLSPILEVLLPAWKAERKIRPEWSSLGYFADWKAKQLGVSTTQVRNIILGKRHVRA